MVAVLKLGVYQILVSNGCPSRSSRRTQRKIPSRNACWTAKAVSRWNSSRLRQTADRNIILILWKHCCQRLVICAVSRKSLLKSWWHICVALRQEWIANHISEVSQRKSRLGVGMHRKVLRKCGSSGNTCTRQVLGIRLRCRNGACS